MIAAAASSLYQAANAQVQGNDTEEKFMNVLILLWSHAGPVLIPFCSFFNLHHIYIYMNVLA